jgi:hypothetical protein
MERVLSASSVERLNWQSAQRARVRVHSSGYIVIVIGRYSNSSKCENRGDRGQNTCETQGNTLSVMRVQEMSLNLSAIR